ncbi:hypothetical protein [Streptomyces turgidiscabies]|uniref:hypothetical protein n=1 Tax=Streptomyces turgidiscabies TaxID=85558 RepID=UPI0038F600B1
MQRMITRALLLPAVAASLVVGLATSSYAGSHRLDVSTGDAWAGYAELQTSKSGGTWFVTGTLYKIGKGRCLVLEADNGTFSLGSDTLARNCSKRAGTTVRVNSNTNKSRLILRFPKMGLDETSTQNL